MKRKFDWFSSFWVVFLLIPLYYLWATPYPLWAQVMGSVGLLGFLVDYIHEVNELPFLSDLPAVAIHEYRWPPLAPMLRLLTFTVITAVATTWVAVSLAPYFAALILFTTRLRTGIPLTLLLAGATAAVAMVPAPGAKFSAIGCAASTVFVIISRLGAEQELRHYRLSRTQAALAEREEIARDVHDLLGHSLTVLTLKTEVAGKLVDRDPEAAKQELAQVVDLSRKALADIRATVTRLRAPDLASQVEATRTAFTAAGIDATIDVAEVPLPQRELLAWALREATTNIVRHAAATRALVKIAPGRLIVVDDGRGSEAAPGNGLTGLRARVEAAGGRVELTSPAPRPLPGGGPGTELEVEL